jgi:hypothetical protein
MRFRNSIGATALAVALMMTIGGAAAFDETKYPDLKGQWRRAVNRGLLAGGAGGLRYDDSKPPALTPSLGQEPPLTPEYQAIYEANLADMVAGGQGIDPTYACISPGMPRVMIGYSSLEFVVTPETTYILMERDHDFYRRIYTDGRDFPASMAAQPKFLGYSVGKWLDEGGRGRYDTLVVETRGLKGPRVYDATGIPLHADNETIVKERLYLDKANPNVLHNEMTTTDNSLTRPWTVTKNYRRRAGDVTWEENNCVEGNAYITINKQVYFVSGDGHLMPQKKDQPAPDLRYFSPVKK